MNQNLRIPSALLNDVVMDAVAINPTPTDKGKTFEDFFMQHKWQSNHLHLLFFCQRRRTNALFLMPGFFRKSNQKSIYV